jgi:hypothetical protein
VIGIDFGASAKRSCVNGTVTIISWCVVTLTYMLMCFSTRYSIMVMTYGIVLLKVTNVLSYMKMKARNEK